MSLSFEEQLKKLEELVKELESKDISLDDAIKKYKEGIELSKSCYEKIKEAESLVIQEIK
ncbi:MAG: exodeoxyribonuclease VII small subunit [Candidatus Phytoplasma sp.]|nr:exodeoxyribonuclease VII small subunit [Phytoplasma sp.]